MHPPVIPRWTSARARKPCLPACPWGRSLWGSDPCRCRFLPRSPQPSDPAVSASPASGSRFCSFSETQRRCSSWTVQWLTPHSTPPITKSLPMIGLILSELKL